MYVSVRRYRMKKTGSVPDLMRRVDSGFANILSKAPGSWPITQSTPP
jgi:hypothetical protein